MLCWGLVYTVYSSYLTSCRSKGLGHDNKCEIGTLMIRTLTQNLNAGASQNSAVVFYFIYVVQLFAHLIHLYWLFSFCPVSGTGCN